jgi:hypothetical protein
LILSRVAFRRPFHFFLGRVGTHVALLVILPLQRKPPVGYLDHTLNLRLQDVN